MAPDGVQRSSFLLMGEWIRSPHRPTPVMRMLTVRTQIATGHSRTADHIAMVKRVSRTELLQRLGRPGSTGVQVMFENSSTEPPLFRHARMLWICDPERSSRAQPGCPSNCIAWNRLPYATSEFEASNFPETTWVLSPCEKHADLFADFADVPTGTFPSEE
jgi:hypothetical protein